MVLKYYFDLMSQPSRALYCFLKYSKIPFEPCPVALRKGEHHSEEFKQNLNRFGKVPFIHDGNFKMAESVAIIRYLSEKHNIDNQWYPKDLQKRAKIDEYLEWQHLNIRVYCSLYFQKKWIIPILTGEETKPDVLARAQDGMETCLAQFQELFLSNSPFITGNELTVADIFAAAEIEQPRMAGYEPGEGRPILAAWLERVRKDASPFYEEANVIVNKIIKSTKKSKL